MPRDNENKSSLDYLRSAGESALALGVGAAFLFGGKGGKELSHVFSKSKKIIGDFADDAAKTAFKDMDIEFLKRSRKRALENMKLDISKEKIKLTHDTSKNIFGALAEIATLKENPDRLLRRRFNSQRVHELREKLLPKLSRGDIEKANSIKNIIEKAYGSPQKAFLSKMNKDGSTATFFKRDFLEKEVLNKELKTDEISDILRTLKNAQIKRESEYSKFVNLPENKKLVKDTAEKLGEAETLAGKFGRRAKEKTVKESLTGNRNATVRDVLDNPERFENHILSVGKNKQVDLIEELRKLADANPEAYDDINIGSLLKINDDGELFSFVGAKRTKDKAKDAFGNTLPGKIIKAREQLYRDNDYALYYMPKGTYTPLLSASEKGVSSYLEDDHLYIMGRIFKHTDEEGLKLVEDADKWAMVSGRHGTEQYNIKRILGHSDRPKELKEGFFDIGNSMAPSAAKELGSVVKKYSDPMWERNVLEHFMYGDVSEDMLKASREYLEEEYKKVEKLSSAFKYTTDNLSERSIARLIENSSGLAKSRLQLLEKDPETILNELVNEGFDSIKNPDLATIISSYAKDPTVTLERLQINTNPSIKLGSTKALNIKDILKKELTKEHILEVVDSKGMDNSIFAHFEQAGIDGIEKQKANHMAVWAMFQDQIGYQTSDSKIKSLENIEEAVLNAHQMFKLGVEEGTDITGNENLLNAIRINTEKVFKEKYAFYQKGDVVDPDDIVKGIDYGDRLPIKKAVTILDVLNDTTKAKAFAKQFVAGRDTPEDITTATIAPFFFMNRLMTPLESLGLSFSDLSTKDAPNLAANIMMKRVLPIGAALTAVGYADYELKNLTGTGVKGAFANAAANTDLALRGIADATGIGGAIDTHRDMSPGAQYLFGDDYMDREEREEWYQNGYSEVRKGRWWAFGSTSEFRGGKIDYFQPNYLKRAHSDWYDIGVYGSTKNRWSHSLIPTPRHPLSTLNYLADPYWNERRTYNERPYPMTGKMFGEGAPWSGVLNLTIGNLVKPQRRMHEEHLGDSMIDVRSLIEKKNRELMEEADNVNVIEADGYGNFMPAKQRTLMPNNTQVSSINVSADGRVSTPPSQQYLNPEGASFEQYGELYEKRAELADSYGKSGYSDAVVNSLMGSLPQEKGIIEKLSGGADSSNPLKAALGGMVKNVLGLEQIRSSNQQIMERAEGKGRRIVTPDQIFSVKAKYGNDLLHHKELLSDLKNTTVNDEYLKDIGYSVKQLSGMYGFLFEQVIPGETRNVLDDASSMDSFSRRFWDSGVGGVGGEFMEIARRFFPHQNHDVNKVNPIRNTMPDWMPQKFLTGDPYASIPKGEMRLPGAGYEDIHELHSDSYGVYGAFDRMKILADVAPWSAEYKTWREIASSTVKDPELKQEMRDIKKRVMEQSKNHDFYHYNFLGRDLDKKEATIENMLTDTTFTVLGDDKVYSLASVGGIDKNSGDAMANYLQPGMAVTLAYDENDPNNGRNISAVVYADGENLNKALLDSGAALESDDNSSAGAQAKLTSSQIGRAKIYEAIAHAPIPILHNKFLRVDSPIESYEKDQIYGTSFSTWDRPIEGFVKPAFRQAFAIGAVHQTIASGAWLASEVINRTDATKGAKMAVDAVWALSSPGAFAGGTMGTLLKLGFDETLTRNGARIGALVGLAGYAAASTEDPIKATYSFAMLGGFVGNQLFGKTKEGALVKGLIAGAVTGLALSGQKKALLDNEDRDTYIPENTERRWEIEEYYDRLKYIKYMGLYEKASREAKSKEGIDIKRILETAEYVEEKRKELIDSDLTESNMTSESGYSPLMDLTQPAAVLKGGEYTKSAIAYKQAAESTIFGLRESASWAQLLRALPKNERDYMLEFSKVKDENERKKILGLVSPYQRKVLDLAWGNKPKSVESNFEYFKSHYLPNGFWSGWDPSIDLDNVKIKTIQNEGMLLSDFGVYESELEDFEYKEAPRISNIDSDGSVLNMVKNLTATLSGLGLFGVDVSVQPSAEPGIQMFANIVRTSSYEFKNKVGNALGIPMYGTGI